MKKRISKAVSFTMVFALLLTCIFWGNTTTLPVSAVTGIEIEGVSFNENVKIDSAFTGSTTFSESYHEGGLVYVFVRNNTGATVTIDNLYINSTAITSITGDNNSVNWWRAQPSTLSNGQLGTIAFHTGKGANSPAPVLKEGNTITFRASASGYNSPDYTTTMVDSKFRIGSIIPTPDMTAVKLYVRNEDPNVYYNITKVVVNNDVTSSVQYKNGSTIWQKRTEIMTVNMGRTMTANEPLSVYVTAQGSDGSTRTFGAVVKAIPPKFTLGAWNQGRAAFDFGTEEAKARGLNTQYTDAESSDIGRAQQYAINGIGFMSDPRDTWGLYNNNTKLNDNIGNSWLTAYKIMDEPDNNAGNYPPSLMNIAYNTISNTDPGHPTFMNVARSNYMGMYNGLADIGCLDRYAIHAPLCSTPNKKLQAPDWYSKAQKRITEPRVSYAFSQAAASTWGDEKNKRIPAWIVRSQAWQQLNNGIKGLLWFDANNYIDNTINAGQKYAVNQVNKEVLAYKDSLLYGDTWIDYSCNKSNVEVGAIVSEDKMILTVSNMAETWSTESLLYQKCSLASNTGVTVSLNLPPWIGTAKVNELRGTEEFGNTFTKVINGGNIQLTFDLEAASTSPVNNQSHTNSMGSTRVFVIGNVENVAPSAPTYAVKKDSALDSTKTMLVWNDAVDNVGIKEYYVYRNGTHFATTTFPYYYINKTERDSYTYTVAARDMDGNQSATKTIS